MSDRRVSRRIRHTTPDWCWRLNEFTSVLDYLPPLKMSEAENRKAKAARAKALVRTLSNELKPALFLTCRLAQEEATSHEVRQESPTVEDVHPVTARPTYYGFTHDPSRRNPEHGGHASLTCLETPHPRRTHTELVYLQSRFGQTPEADGTWLNSLSRVDNAPASLSTTGVSEQGSPTYTRLPHGEPPANSPTHNLLQSLRADLQRQQDTIALLKSERDALNKELDRRKDLETSGFSFGHLLAPQMTNA